MEQDTQKSTCEHNPEEITVESSVEFLNEEELHGVTGGVNYGGR